MSLEVDPTTPLTASGNLRRRQVVNRLAEGGANAAALLAVVVLGIVIASVAVRGAPALSLDFLIKSPPRFGGAGGGIAPAIVGTAVIIFTAAVIAVPIGVLVAIFLMELAGGRTAAVVRLALDLLNGVPSIVIGLFAFGLLVVGNHQSGFAGALALAVIMVPLVARAAQEMLVLIPTHLRDAADALGVSRWRTSDGVLLPSAMGGIATGLVLAIARAAGETAPLIFTNSVFSTHTTVNIFGASMPNIPVLIFQDSESAFPADHARAWGAAFVLIILILIGNLSARALYARQQRRIVSR